MKIQYIKNKEGKTIDTKIVLEKYEILVRSDIMPAKEFLEIKMKYEKLIRLIKKAGGYVFSKQIANWGNNRNLPSKMKKMGLITGHKKSGFDYAVLTDKSLRFIAYADTIKDFSDVDRSKLIVTKLRKEVGNTALHSSAILFEYFKKHPEENNWLNKKRFDNYTKDFWEGNERPRAKEAISKIVGLRKNAKIYIAIGVIRKKDKTMFNGTIGIIDHGSETAASHYIKCLIETIMLYDEETSLSHVRIDILSYSEIRALKIKDDLIKLNHDKKWFRLFCETNKTFNQTLLKLMFQTEFEINILTEGHGLIDLVSNDLTIKKDLKPMGIGINKIKKADKLDAEKEPIK